VNGDTVVDTDHWRSYVRLQLGGSTCGGTMIQPDKILTAAHCVTEGTDTEAQRRTLVTQVVAEIGWTSTSDRGNVQTIGGAASKIQANPRWATHPGSSTDVAIITLDSCVADAQIAILEDAVITANERVWAIGAGNTQLDIFNVLGVNTDTGIFGHTLATPAPGDRWCAEVAVGREFRHQPHLPGRRTRQRPVPGGLGRPALPLCSRQLRL